jgi:RNA polymerase sigma-70 factor (ECF subfamily)
MVPTLTYDDLSLLYDRHFEKLYRFFYYKVLDKTEAEDLTADTFMAVAKAIQEGRAIHDAEKFLYGVAKIIFTTFLQRKYKQVKISIEEYDLEEVIAATETEVDDSPTLEERLIKYLPDLPPKQREVLRLRFIDKLTVAETCEKLNKDSNYVRTTQKRGLQTLREIIATQVKLPQPI